MVDILKRVFLAFSSGEGVEKVGGSLPPACNALLVGEQRICRSLLLLAAVTAAAQAGMAVQFFAQAEIPRLPVCLQRCVPNVSPESLKKIKFSYPGTLAELLQQVARLHESGSLEPSPPSLIIVDRLEGFLAGPGPGLTRELSSAAHLAALLCDTAAFLTSILERRVSSSASCRVLASFQSEDVAWSSSLLQSPPVLDVLDRYFSGRCTLDRDSSYEAAASGLQEIWNIYFSGPGVSEASSSAVDAQWQLLVGADDSMEFKLTKR
ncbi:ATPase SWSAP1 [Synchiropus splendidus]|uniref:ATPase SWSAP1 n=1 Tax=Synchiropus splendidus TaxID=270530 RepID=UPI00237D8119|nr:ATPase SWSAP1 [Synchiropus splendidus]